MKFPLKPYSLPFFTLSMGGIGLALHSWLFTGGLDEKGLLETGHIAGVLLFVLSAVVLALLFLTIRILRPVRRYCRLFPASVINAIGCALGAATLLYTSIAGFRSGADIFSRLLLPLGVAAAIALAYIAVCRYQGRMPLFYLSCIPTVYMMLRLVSVCRVWGAEPQLLQFFFPLMASVFLLLTCYQYSALIVQAGSCSVFLFYNQAALFFCCISLNTQWRIFFLGMAAWMAADMCTLHQPRKRIPPEEKQV